MTCGQTRRELDEKAEEGIVRKAERMSECKKGRDACSPRGGGGKAKKGQRGKIELELENKVQYQGSSLD